MDWIDVVEWWPHVAEFLNRHAHLCVLLVGVMTFVIQLQIRVIRRVVQMRGGEVFYLKKKRADLPLPVAKEK